MDIIFVLTSTGKESETVKKWAVLKKIKTNMQYRALAK